MADIKVWYVLTDKRLKPLTSPSSVILPHNGLIDDLKKVIADEMRPSQVIAHISCCELQAWGHSSPMISANNTITSIEGLLRLSSNMLYQIPVTAKVT